jgi:hypothetical protein
MGTGVSEAGTSIAAVGIDKSEAKKCVADVGEDAIARVEYAIEGVVHASEVPARVAEVRHRCIFEGDTRV